MYRTIKKKLILSIILLLNVNILFSQWNQIGQTITGTAQSFGSVVSISGNGMRIASVNASSNGYINVYELQGTVWQPLGNPIGPLSITSAGHPLDLDYDGDRLVVSNVNVVNSTSYGSCFLTFSFNGLDWEQLGDIHICGDYDNLIIEDYGGDVKISDDGNRILLAAPSVGNLDVYLPGFVEVYELVSNVWTLMGDRILIGYYIWDDRGISLTMNTDGSKIAIGITGAPTFSNGSSPPNAYSFGQVAVYDWQNSNWNYIGDTTVAGNNIVDFVDSYGSGVSFNGVGDKIAVGTLGDDTAMNNAGKVEVYQLNTTNGSWSQIGNTIYGETVNHEIGRAVALNRTDNVLSIGASGKDANGNYGVKVYKLLNNNWILVDDAIVFGSNISANPYNYLKYSSFMEFSESGRLALGFPYDPVAGKVQVFENPSLSIGDNFEPSVKVYPNPVEDFLFLELDNVTKGELTIMSLYGQKLINKTVPSTNQLQIDASPLASKGIYILKLVTDDGTLTKKIIKE